jgi:hypothetical protein
MRIGTREQDPGLRRFERDAVIACVGMALVALAVAGGRPEPAVGVIAGGLLAAMSYRAIKGGVDLLIARAAVSRRAAGREGEAGGQASEGTPLMSGEASVQAPVAAAKGSRAAVSLVKFFTRYALLAIAAYVMLTRLRLHPLGVVIGVSSPAVAAAAEAVRLLRAGRPREAP